MEGQSRDAEIRDDLTECLGEIARRWGIAFPPNLLRSLARSEDGRLPFHQAGPAIELLGLNFELASGKRLPRSSQYYPAIVSIEGGHSIVVHELKDEDALVWKPGSDASIWLPRKEVEEEFAGGFITALADQDSMRDEEAPWHAKGRRHWFWSEVRKERGSFRPVLLASLLINLLALALPLFTMNVYDRVIPNRTGSTLWVLATGVVLAIAIEFSLRAARARVIDEIGQRLDLALSQKIYSRLLATPLFARQGHTGGLAARVAEYAIVRDFFASTTVVLLVDAAFLILFVAVIALIAGWLAFVPLIAMTGMAIAGYILQKKVVDAARDAQADHGLQQTMLVESIAGVETLKAMAGEGGMLGRWRRLAEAGSRSQQRLKHIATLATGLAATFQQASTIMLIIGGYYLFAAGDITMGAIIAIVMLASRSLSPAGQIAFLLTRGRQANETLESIERLFEAEDERRLGSVSIAPQIRDGGIKLDGLEFTYPEASRPALEGIDLTIEPGERIAIIGRVASGKSTLGRVLCGLYPPTGGAMLFDGVDSRQYRPQEIREAFRFVGQDADLFTGSVKDNLLLGRADATEEALLHALRLIGADQFLARDAGGFDRAVGEHGRRLSGGQRSFLALARAFVSPAKLIYLDEPTGAMDSQTEKLFVDRLSQSLTEGQTLIISTHRPALFSLCHRLIVLDNGRVAADGPKDEIIARSGVAVERQES